MKVMTVVGTRPEIVRLSRTILELDRRVEHVLVHTGQNWDPQLSGVFFNELGLRNPDHQLTPQIHSLGAFLGGVLAQVDELLELEKPDAFLVLGDTNSSIAAVVAKRRAIPVFHMEAGNRSFDENVPEETNRRMIDHISDYNLCYTEHARRNLLSEGLSARRTFVTGSPLAEVLQSCQPEIDASDVLERLQLGARSYLLVSLHREENIDNPAALESLLSALLMLRKKYACEVIISTHPRLRRRLDGLGPALSLEGLRFLEPFGFFDYNKLQQASLCVLSDSGTISEESAISSFPAVTIRNSMERPEALDAGSIILTGMSPGGIEQAVALAVGQWSDGYRPTLPVEYTWQECSQRVVKLIVGLSAVHSNWLNLAPKSAPIRPAAHLSIDGGAV